MKDEGRGLAFVVGPGEAGGSMAEVAARLAGEVGTTAVARGGAWVDGRRVTDPGERVGLGEVVTLRLPPGGVYADVALGAADIAYEDEWLVALHKAAGWYAAPTPWDVTGNVLAALGRFLVARDGAAPSLHLAHRLDRDTSGVLLVSRAQTANGALQAAFAARQVTKHYTCLCAGVPAWTQLDLRTGHGRSANGRWRVYALDEVGMELPSGGGRVKEASSSFTREGVLAGAALLGAEPHTGRTHQLRLHLAHLGHPILGDARYGGPTTYAGRPLAGHLLHAGLLRLPHPISGAALEIASPLPKAFRKLLTE